MLGRSLGNYGVVSKIGEGGMGVVYLARHATLGRPAAVKVLRSALSSNQDIVSRFFNEARAATAIRDPGVVEVYDFGFLEDRTAYIIMEYLEGESLAARMRRGRCSVPVALAIIRAIARALHAVHDHSIIHRDLKPDNVFLVPDSEIPSGDRIKLLDFGIAKITAVSDASRTSTGTVLGTPLYMSPEQCRGAGEVDHRSDLYSLGCIAYELLCGQPPFAVDGPGDVMARHLYFEPPTLRSRHSDVPLEVEDVVLRLLRKAPRERYRNAAALIRAIDQLIASIPPADVAAGDFVPTLPMVLETASTKVSETTLRSAASSVDVPKTRARDRRLGLIAATATMAIALIVVIIIFAARGDDGGQVSPAAAPPSPPVAPSDASCDAKPPGDDLTETAAPLREARSDASRDAKPPGDPDLVKTPVGLEGPRRDADASSAKTVARSASSKDAGPHAADAAPPPASEQPAAGGAPDAPPRPLSPPKVGRARPPANNALAQHLHLACSPRDDRGRAGEKVHVACALGNTSSHLLEAVTGDYIIERVPGRRVFGPMDIEPMDINRIGSQITREFDVDVPVNASAGPLRITVVVKARSWGPVERTFAVQVGEVSHLRSPH